MYTVSSEIYKETNFQSTKTADGKVISKFSFCYPEDEEQKKLGVDKDGDLMVRRRQRKDQIEIEHSEATELKLVGLQVWRGALLLADFIFSRRKDLAAKHLLELGAGMGLTSIAGAIYAKKVTCTDMDRGCILKLIRANVERNARLIQGSVEVLEYNFLQAPKDYKEELLNAIDESDIILAADVIYDDELTSAFIKVLDFIFTRGCITGRIKTVYMTLEKRYVFTLAECDAVAPMFEYFVRQTINKPWRFVHLNLDFPQYFKYERCKELVLMELTAIH